MFTGMLKDETIKKHKGAKSFRIIDCQLQLLQRSFKRKFVFSLGNSNLAGVSYPAELLVHEALA